MNLATFLLVDGFKDDYESAVVISNDSDLIEPIQAVRRELGLKVGVIIPGDIPRSALRADFYRRIRRGNLAASQFPSSIVDSKGVVRKPSEW